ncbi:MAG: LLM class F420-dependent oxidoreductase [Acidimicrobiales bacterium]
MDIGRVGLWQNVLDQQPTARVRELVAELEGDGWPCLWYPESTGRDAMVSGAVLLSATRRMRVATGIAQIHARHPLTTAAAQKTLAEAFDGRFLLGLGVSHQPTIEGVRKLDYSRPYSQMVDYLDAMDDAPFTALGPSEAPPRVLAALGPRMLRLAAERAAGAHPYFVPPEHTAFAREVMGEGPLLAVEQMVVLDTDLTAGRALAREHMARYLALPNYANNLRRLGYGDDDLLGEPSDRLVDAVVVCGDETAIAARVKAHHDAGADHVCVQVLVQDRLVPPRGAWRRLAAALLGS